MRESRRTITAVSLIRYWASLLSLSTMGALRLSLADARWRILHSRGPIPLQPFGPLLLLYVAVHRQHHTCLASTQPFHHQPRLSRAVHLRRKPQEQSQLETLSPITSCSRRRRFICEKKVWKNSSASEDKNPKRQTGPGHSARHQPSSDQNLQLSRA